MNRHSVCRLCGQRIGAPELLTTVEAAVCLGISRQAVGKAIRAGRLKARRPGRDWLIERQIVDSYRKVGR